MLNSILGREGTPDTVGAGLGLVLDTYKDQLHRNMFTRSLRFNFRCYLPFFIAILRRSC